MGLGAVNAAPCVHGRRSARGAVNKRPQAATGIHRVLDVLGGRRAAGAGHVLQNGTAPSLSRHSICSFL